MHAFLPLLHKIWMCNPTASGVPVLIRLHHEVIDKIQVQVDLKTLQNLTKVHFIWVKLMVEYDVEMGCYFCVYPYTIVYVCTYYCI